MVQLVSGPKGWGGHWPLRNVGAARQMALRRGWRFRRFFNQRFKMHSNVKKQEFF